MANTVPMTKEEADTFLRGIRQGNRVDEPNSQNDRVVESLQNALNSISDNLYTKPTHFLLELIQNVDDNIYSSPDPKLTLTTLFLNSVRQIRIDYNEDGFTKENIEAICKAGVSTKMVSEGMRGYIGEKGIGFKSVFKVADTVHISSGPWSFGLDRRNVLGMITPILEVFPSELFPGQTQVLLDLRSEQAAWDISNELTKIEPALLIFLRKLKTIEIKTHLQHVIYRATSQNIDDLGGEIVTIRVENRTGNSYRVHETIYMIVRHHLTGISAHENRPGVSESEIILAFPVSEDAGELSPQYTYAYLPIADYGFKYLIQADFFLLANRESIDYAAGWNISLQEGIVEAFDKAVSRFNAIPRTSVHSRLRYTWPRFLKRYYGPSPQFWIDLRDKIEFRLKNKTILELQNQPQILGLPPCLKFVPELYRLEEQPLLNELTFSWDCLSFRYDQTSATMPEELGLLGVTQMTFDDFFRQFFSLLTTSGAQFLQTQSIQWHVQVSRILRKNGSRARVTPLPLIPLRDGRWVTASENHLFLDVEEDNSDVPHGINVSLVDVDAWENQDRRRLYIWLGLKSCKRFDVCRLIVELHSSTYPSRTAEELVSDALYLFNTASFVGRIDALGLYGDDGLVHRLHAYLHIDVPGASFVISRFSGNAESGIKLLHPAYLQAIDQEARKSTFVQWLLNRTAISRLPLLVHNGHNTQIFNFFANNAPGELLLLFRDNWGHYFSPRGPRRRQQDIHLLRQRVSKLSVRCTDGLYRSLDETTLPLPELQAIGRNLPFLDVPDPGNLRWLVLKILGVLTDKSMNLYLRQLKALAGLDNPSAVEVSAVQEIYTQLGNCSQSPGDMEMLRSEFRNSLVFIPNLHRWVPLQECLWHAPPCLKSLHRLSNRYRDCRILFRHILQLGDATIEHFVNELESLPSSAPISHRKQLLLELSNYVERDQAQPFFLQLRNKFIIPVRLVGDVQIMAYDSSQWYIADTKKLHDSFSGSIWLIEFTVDEVPKILALVRAMRCENKLLSRVVEESYERRGDPIYDQGRTTEFRERAQYFLPLLPDSIKLSPHLLQSLTTRLQELNVWSILGITIVRRIGTIYGREGDSKVIFAETDTTLDIYIAMNVEEVSLLLYALAQQFIEHCKISDARYLTLVRSILDCSIPGIRAFLEEQNIHGLENINRNSVSDITSDYSASGDAQPIRSSVTHTAAQMSTIESGVLNEWTAQPSNVSVTLQESIPTLDQSISRVREAASSLTTALFSVTASARTQIRARPRGFHQGDESSHLMNSGLEGSQAGAGDYTAAGGFFQEPTVRNTFNHENLPSLQPVISSNSFHLPDVQQGPAYSTMSRPRGTALRNHFWQGNRISPQPSHLGHIGLFGESFIDAHFSGMLPNWDYTCWTSRNRVKCGHPPFTESEGNYTDFTYIDSQKALTRMLIAAGYGQAEEWISNPESLITYHMEVKSTNRACEEGFYMSNNQVEMAREYTLLNVAVPTDVYVILRVHNLSQQSGTPSFKTYIDPWALYLDRSLRLEALDNYVVTPIFPRA